MVRVVLHPYVSEKAMILMENENKLVMVVRRDAKAKEVKEDVEKLYDVEVDRVNLYITPKGEKHAIVKLKPDYSAEEIGMRIGVF
jgi:large subunit ribosomal protein L23